MFAQVALSRFAARRLKQRLSGDRERLLLKSTKGIGVERGHWCAVVTTSTWRRLRPVDTARVTNNTRISSHAPWTIARSGDGRAVARASILPSRGARIRHRPEHRDARGINRGGQK